MRDEPTAVSPLRALLVGVEDYPAGKIAGGASIESLRGCVGDVLAMRRLLLRLGVPPSRIRLLTSPVLEQAGGAESAVRPTKRNLVAAVRALLADCDEGDQAVIQFAGHGTWLPTAFPELEDVRGGVDAALVPVDATDPEQPLLRDLELAHLLRQLVEKGVFVTLILDACHSGGQGFRDDRPPRGGVRTARNVQGIARPLGEEVAGRDELIDSWRWWCQPPDPQRDWIPNWQTGDSGWLPIPRGYALLTACRAEEEAVEVEVEDAGYRGLFTHLLISALDRGGANLTYEALHGRVVSAAQGLGKEQTPQLEGEADRRVFGGVLRFAEPAIRVSRHGERLLVAAGSVHGLREGGRLRLLVEGEEGGTPRRATLERVLADRSWAVPEDGAGEPTPEGAFATATPLRAVVEDPGHDDLRSVVALRTEGTGAAARAALDAVAVAAAEAGSPFLRPAGRGERADLQVAVEENGAFAVLDRRGLEVALQPELPAEPGSAARLVDRLDHLARFRNVERLRNRERWAVLAGEVELEAALLAAGEDPGATAPRTVPLPRCDGVYQVELGQKVCLTLRNRSRFDLYCAVLDLCPSWRIHQIYPAPEARPSVLLPRASERPTEHYHVITAGLPDGYDQGGDVLKLFACLRPVDFRWLQLPVLGSGPVRGAVEGRPIDPLQALFRRLVVDPLRGEDDDIPASDEWTTVEIETHIRRR